MAYRIPLGSKMENPTVNKSNVAEGFPGRAVLLGENCVYGKAQTYDDRIKRSIEVDQDSILKYRFEKVFTYYYILIARLNTDNRGNVVSDDIVIEYLRLTEKQWDDLTIQMNEMGSFTSLLLTKVTKKGNDNRDFSYVEVKPSNYKDIPSSVFAKVEKLVQTPNFVDNVWNMVDASTTITVDMYEQKLKEYYESQATQQIGQGSQVGKPQTAIQSAPAPQSPAPQINVPQPPRRIIQGTQHTVQPTTRVAPSGAAVITPAAPAQVMEDPSFDEAMAQDTAMAGFEDNFANGDFEAPGELE